MSIKGTKIVQTAQTTGA